MRVNYDDLEIGDYKFVIDLETGGAPQEEVVVWLYHKSDKPLINEQNIQFRRYFDMNENVKHVKNFCKKFASNKDYRDSQLESFT